MSFYSSLLLLSSSSIFQSRSQTSSPGARFLPEEYKSRAPSRRSRKCMDYDHYRDVTVRARPFSLPRSSLSRAIRKLYDESPGIDTTRRRKSTKIRTNTGEIRCPRYYSLQRSDGLRHSGGTGAKSILTPLFSYLSFPGYHFSLSPSLFLSRKLFFTPLLSLSSLDCFLYSRHYLRNAFVFAREHARSHDITTSQPASQVEPKHGKSWKIVRNIIEANEAIARPFPRLAFIFSLPFRG